MKKLILSAVIIFVALLFYGCGQKVDVTVYNTGWPIGGAQWLVTSASWNGGSMNQPFTGRAYDLSGLAANNSFTFEARENDNLVITANGQQYQIDTSGNTTLVDAEFNTGTTLYGGFLDTAHWYAAVYMDAIVIYKQ